MTLFISTNDGFPVRVRAIKDGGPFYDITKGQTYKALKQHFDPRDCVDYFEIEHDDLKDTWDVPVDFFEVIDTFTITPLSVWQVLKDTVVGKLRALKDFFVEVFSV